MRLVRLLLVSAVLFACTGAQAQEIVYKYRVYLKDKKESPYKKSRPLEFLSQKALDRRAKWKIKIDDKDLPVSPAYLSKLAVNGTKVLCMSKWNNTVLVQNTDSAKLEALAGLPFVSKVQKVFAGTLYEYPDDIKEKRLAEIKDSLAHSATFYGASFDQVHQLNGTLLHNAGFRGKGMTIAIIDGGFHNADAMKLLDNVKILGTHNFVRPNQSVYDENSHGMSVLSCIGANKPNVLVGTAPEAEFWLLVSEDSYSETPAEEDYWAAAVEYADSVGADVVNTSLGYNDFDDDSMNVKYCELDGKSRLNSRSASLAASRGLMLVHSAGNSGNDSWKLITPPADASDVITVGAVVRSGENTLFSSLGNTADGRIKPDIMAMGQASAVARSDGQVGHASGTSFSSPITAGMVACLMQALPEYKPEEIIDLLHKSGNYSEHPNNIYGYGIPDYWEAYLKGRYRK